VRGDSVVRFVI